MSTVTCLSCAKLSLRWYPKEAKEGWGRCPSFPPLTLVAFDKLRECDKFKPQDEAIANKLVARWVIHQNKGA